MVMWQSFLSLSVVCVRIVLFLDTYLLCIELISKILGKFCADNRIRPIKIGRSREKLSHLFYVDDALIFCERMLHPVNNLTSTLRIFGKFTCLLVNNSKSTFLALNLCHMRNSSLVVLFSAPTERFPPLTLSNKSCC